jgi:hypothetical protein
MGGDSLTAEEKFNLLLSGGSGLDALVGGSSIRKQSQTLEEVKNVPKNENRRTFNKS